MKRNRGKNKYSYEGPLIKENRLYIGLNFVFTGINSLIIAFYHFSDKVDFRMNVWMAITNWYMGISSLFGPVGYFFLFGEY